MSNRRFSVSPNMAPPGSEIEYKPNSILGSAPTNKLDFSLQSDKPNKANPIKDFFANTYNNVKAKVSEKKTNTPTTTVIDAGGSGLKEEKSEGTPIGVSQDNWSLYQKMNKISKQQMGLDTVRAGEYLINALQAANQKPSEGFVAPDFSYTPIQSTRDRDLAELRRQTKSAGAKTMNYLEERGLGAMAPAVTANLLDNERSGKFEIGNREIQRKAAEANRFDNFQNSVSAAQAQTRNQNIQKAMGENQALGAEYTGNIEKFFNIGVDLNRQRSERAMIESLARSPENSNVDMVGRIMKQYKWAEEDKNSKRTND